MAISNALSLALRPLGLRLESRLGSCTGVSDYEGRELSEDRRILVRVLEREGDAALDAGAFVSEIEPLIELRHDALVSVHSCGEVDGSAYWVVDHVIGVTLRDKLDAHGVPHVAQALGFLERVADALRAAHSHGVFHLDLSGEQVFVSGPTVKVARIGVYQAMRAAGIQGLDRAVEEETDVAQFGALAFELLTGRAADTATPAESPRAAWASALSQREDVPSGLANVVLRCLDVEASDRMRDMDGVIALLDAIEPPAWEGSGAGDTSVPGEEIDRYRLVRVLGRGGVGVVYLAEQTEPVEREVALKLIKPGMDTAEVLSRFETERQMLAAMDHPNIARVFDSGRTATGRPYFVMEFVRGEDLLTYCDQRRLTLRERVGLLIEVCRAVQHAHQKGVIHRDLKPTNVIVATHDQRALPRVIDFGLAKAVGGPDDAEAGLTRVGQIVGTPAYMSPEQISGSITDIDTRTDVYALGVILSELLTGGVPFEDAVISGNTLELREARRNSDAPRPSNRFMGSGAERAAIAELRGTSAAALSRQLSGDLDWIVLKAMATDADDRYETVNALARDLERYLADEEVEAGEPPLRYRIGKFVRRHRTGVAIATTTTAAVLAGLVATTTQWLRAVEAERVAVEEAAISAEVTEFLNDLFRQADVTAAPVADATARELLDQAAATLDDRFADEPFVLARLKEALGTTYSILGFFDKADSLLVHAVRITERTRGSGTDLAYMLNALGSSRIEQGQYDSAAVLLERAIELGASGVVLAAAHSNLGAIHYSNGDYEAAASEHGRAAEIVEEIGGDSLMLAATLVNVGNSLKHLGNFEAGDSASWRALRIREEILGPDHPQVAASLTGLGSSMTDQGRLAEAEEHLLRAIRIKEAALGPHDRSLATSRGLLARVYRRSGRHAEALVQDSLSLDIFITAYGPEHPFVGTGWNGLGDAYFELGDFERAAEAFLNGKLITEKTRPGHINMLVAFDGLGRVYSAQGRYAESDSQFRAACTFLEGMSSPLPTDFLAVLGNYADMLSAAGWTEELAHINARMDSIRASSEEPVGG